MKGLNDYTENETIVALGDVIIVKGSKGCAPYYLKQLSTGKFVNFAHSFGFFDLVKQAALLQGCEYKTGYAVGLWDTDKDAPIFDVWEGLPVYSDGGVWEHNTTVLKTFDSWNEAENELNPEKHINTVFTVAFVNGVMIHSDPTLA